MSEIDSEEEHEEAPDLHAEGVAVTRSPRTLFSALSLFAPTAYAGAIVLRDSPRPFYFRVALAIAGLFAVARVSPRIDDLAPETRRSARVALVAGAVAAILAAGLPLDAPATTSFAIAALTVSASLAAAGAVAAGATLVGLGGLGAAPRASIIAEARRIAGAWCVVAIACAFAHLSFAARYAGMVDAPLAVIAAGLTAVHLARTGRRRRHELGARERHELMLGTATLVLPAAILPFASASSLPSAGEPQAGLHLLVWLLACIGPPLAVGALVAHLVADPVRAAARVGRAWVVLTAVAVASAGLVFEETAVIPAVAIGLAIGLLAPSIARSIGIEGEHDAALRAAVQRAREAAATPDPNEVARGVLVALRGLAGGAAPAGGSLGKLASPRLLLFSPLREVILDAAGEARTRDPLPTGESIPDPDAPAQLARVLPEGLLAMVAEEPLGVVRTEVLRALEVRRPEVRSALRWCEARDAAAVVAVVVDGELDGLLLFPSGPSSERLGLRQVRALRSIARLSATRLSLEAALARASARAQRAELRAREVEHVLDRTQDREQRLASGLAGAARPLAARIATIGYAPGSRALLAEIEAVARTSSHLVVLHRPGTDPAPWIARLHVLSGRVGALVVADAAREASDPAHWNDPARSPVELARGGTLLVLAGVMLPRDAQKRILSALAFHEGPGSDPSPVDLRVVISVAAIDPESSDPTQILSALDPALLAHLRSAPIRIAPLARRIEDLHALALDRLVGIAGALGRPPLGLAPDALERLVEHDWDGDDIELESVLVLAAARTLHATPNATRIARAHVEAVVSRAKASSTEHQP